MRNKRNNFVSSFKFQVSSFLFKCAGSGLRLVAFFVILFLSFPSAGCYSQQNNAVKQEEEDKKFTWDFGAVKQGQIPQHDFVLKNESAKVLNITGVNTSCGCTVSQTQKKQLLPGEETRIEVKFDSGKYLGQVKQYVYVNTDSIDNPLIRYIIKANVVSP